MTDEPMDLEAFRAELRMWLAEHAPSENADPDDIDVGRAFQRALYDAGYAGISWPTEWGGRGLGEAAAQAFSEESEALDLPVGAFTIGLGMCGPTIIDLGTTEQKSRFLRPMLRGDEIWCQLFSEPGAGSDVASLQTRAVRDGDAWVLNGQKVWSSVAQHAHFGAVLARTDPEVPKHDGLTMFVVDMRAPGVTVRPLVDMTGAAPFNEVFFDDVRVGGEAVLGQVNGGWRAALTMLSHERMTITGLRHRRSRGLLFAALLERARLLGTTADPSVRARLADLYAHQRARELFAARLREEASIGIAPGARGSVGKLAGALLLWRAVETAGELAGPSAVAWDEEDDVTSEFIRNINAAPASSIAGGTNDIQRSIIGERILGLPKEPAVDRGVPFRELSVGTRMAPAAALDVVRD